MASGKNSYSEADYYSRKAKGEGYPARSVYKLQQIDRKFALLKKRRRILDLGAAPGSWSLYLLRHSSALITAVDLQKIDTQKYPDFKSDRFSFFQGDFTHIFADSEKPPASLTPFDLIVSDAAPATGGSRLIDSSRSLALAAEVHLLSGLFLADGGDMVIKIFQGEEQNEFIASMRKNFNQVKSYKPTGSRSRSAELFIIARGKRQTNNHMADSGFVR